MHSSSPVSWWQQPRDLAWLAFLVWTGVGFVVMPLGIGDSNVHAWLGSGALARTTAALLHQADAIWILLAAVNIYFHVAAAESLATARLWAAIILTAATAFEWVGTSTGFPFGPYTYTDNFGWRIGGVVPVAIPLAWLVIVLGGRYVVRWVYPEAGRSAVALGVALIAVLTDLNLEYVAWKVRAYWVWYPGAPRPLPAWPPWQNYLAWFTLSFVLSAVLPIDHRLRGWVPSPWRPVLVLALMNALLALVHLVR